MTKSEVRTAIADDGDGLIELLAERHAEEGFGEFDPIGARAAVERGIAKDKALIGVIRNCQSGEIEGSVGLYVEKLWDTAGEWLIDRWCFVRQRWRKSANGKLLLIYAKRVASELDRPLAMQVWSRPETAERDKLFERQLPKAGLLFLYNKPAEHAAAG